MLNSLLRRNKPLQPRNGSSMSKLLSFGGSNEPAVAVDLLNNLRELLAARERRLARVLSWPSWDTAA